ncbi:uncharacterized protein H6S33_001327 [Morchella sextelata]|uniref:uncharacterized protein n=1 Tax=Morchella sextelata TaxID=1174677 RepID=UPI001D04D6CC|nr:uncharacterized protein H6S33_001327 [Morchella sextelata]KAH0609099.1 hypothetical protein H6S33_001327 [Morchella sextelata]
MAPPHRHPGTTTRPPLQTPADLHRARTLSQARLKQSWERIFARFSHDFSGIADEIDNATGALLIDNGHLRSLADADADADDDDPNDTSTDGGFSTDDEDTPPPPPQPQCGRCLERDELDNTPPCRHVGGLTKEQILSWTPAKLHTHLAALSARTGIDSCDLSFQLQKHDIDGRALGALALEELETKLRLREPVVVGVVWAEIRRLQRILSGDADEEEEVEEAGVQEQQEEGGEEEDAWAPPPKEEDPFYGAAWRDEHPDGTPAAFLKGKRRREEDGALGSGSGRKRVKVVRVGAPKDAEGTTRRMAFEVAIPARTATPPAAERETPGGRKAVKKHAVETPSPASTSKTTTGARKTPGDRSTGNTTGPGLKSILKTPGLKSILMKPSTPVTATAIAAAAPSKATTTTKTPSKFTTKTASKSTTTPAAASKSTTKAPKVDAPAFKTPLPKTRSKSTTATPAKSASKTPVTKTAKVKTPITTSTPAKTPSKSSTATPSRSKSTPTLKTPTTKTPATKTPKPKSAPAKKTPKAPKAPKTPKTSEPETPGWTTSIDRTKLKGHSFLGFAGADGDYEDELASPGPDEKERRRGRRSGGAEKEKEEDVIVVVGGAAVDGQVDREKIGESGGDGREDGVVATPASAESAATPAAAQPVEHSAPTTTTPSVVAAAAADSASPAAPAPAPAPAAQKESPIKADKTVKPPHACNKKGFCFVCMDLEGEEDDLI